MKIFLLCLFVAAAFAAPAPLDEDNSDAVELIVNGIPEGEPLETGDVLGIKIKEHVEGEVVSTTDLLHPLTAVGLAEAAAANIPQPVEVVQLPEIVEISPEPEPVELQPPVVPGDVPLPPINIPALLPSEPIQVVQLPEIVEVQPEPEQVELAPPVLPGGAPLPPISIPAVIPENIDVPPPISIPALIPDNIDVLPPISIPALIPDNVDIPELSQPELEAPADALPEPVPQIPTGEVFNNGMVQVSVNTPETGVLSTVQSWFNMVLNYFNGSVVTTHQIV